MVEIKYRKKKIKWQFGYSEINKQIRIHNTKKKISPFLKIDG